MSLKWGIIGCGQISHDFVSSLSSLPAGEHQVVACAARKQESAQEFANSHDIPKAYGTYQDLVNDADVQVVYIGAINPQHKDLAKMAINGGKGVLCEKPLCINLKETTELVQLAREKKVFLMEGIWSRFFPAYLKLQEEISNGSIGDVLQVNATFGTLLDRKDRCWLKEMGGGTMLDIGVYNVQFVSFIFGELPQKIIAGGHLNSDGIDESTSATLIYKDGRTATLVTHGRVRLPNEAHVVGTKGTIKVPMRFWCPTELELPSGSKEHFPLPESDKKFNYANSVGLSYEANEVRRCMQKGLFESPAITLEESIRIATIMEDIRKQVGVVYPQDE